jgi:hypothetical protein
MPEGKTNTSFGLVKEVQEHHGKGFTDIKPGWKEGAQHSETAPGTKRAPLAPPGSIPRMTVADRLRQRLAGRAKE